MEMMRLEWIAAKKGRVRKMLTRTKKKYSAVDYRKYGVLLLLSSMVTAMAWCCVQMSELDQAAARKILRASQMREITEIQETSFRKDAQPIASSQRVISMAVMEKEPVWQLNEEDYDTLLRIVEAEAGGEDENGKLLVANVVLNRVKSGLFPDTVKEVVYQQEFGVYQFSPVKDGRIDRVTVSDETRRAVERAVYGEDLSRGALYFAARSKASGESMRWFDNSLTWLFAYGGHEFYG